VIKWIKIGLDNGATVEMPYNSLIKLETSNPIIVIFNDHYPNGRVIENAVSVISEDLFVAEDN
jgi:hypothetical protein